MLTQHSELHNVKQMNDLFESNEHRKISLNPQNKATKGWHSAPGQEQARRNGKDHEV